MSERSQWIVDPTKPPTRKNKSPEHDIQTKLCSVLEAEGLLYSATVGGVRLAMHTAKKMKESGYKKGIPDVLVFEPRGEYVGLAIEVKTGKGVASPEQKEWQRELNKRGWDAHICYGLDECLDVLYDYFELWPH